MLKIPGLTAILLIATLPISACRASAQAPAAGSASPHPERTFTAADVAFMSGMIGHHQQAIVMSRMAEPNGASPQIRTLAGRIINAQQDEITFMKQWLRERHQPLPATDEHAAHGMHHEMMPGMLTEEQMAQLAAARGVDFDVLFLRYMIQHHEGALEMVRQLFASPGAVQEDITFKLASDVNVDQETEVARMRKMLFELLSGKGE